MIKALDSLLEKIKTNELASNEHLRRNGLTFEHKNDF